MAKLTDINNPSFVRFPHATDRTSWRPFGLPMILVVPRVRDSLGNHIPSSGVRNARVYVAESTITPVAGHDNVGKYHPSYELYTRNITLEELNDRIVRLENMEFLDSSGNVVPESDATYAKFTTRTGVTDTILYLDHADYFDLSDIKLDLEDLEPGKYQLIYESEYNLRVTVQDDAGAGGQGGPACIDDSRVVLTRSTFLLNHPGDVILQMTESTPAVYLTSAKRSQDTTIDFYRPFAEVLQDVYDEQDFLEKVNWVFNIPPEHIPYLSQLLGWQIPYYPRSIDVLRRVLIRNIARLQRLKGSKRVIRELFDLFGFLIQISNVWWTPDGKYYLAPGETSPDGYTIGSIDTRTTEPTLTNYTVPGFGGIKIPLTKRPKNDHVLLNAFLVTKDSDAYQQLTTIDNELANDLDALDAEVPSDSVIISSPLDGIRTANGVVGYSQLTINSHGEGTTLEQSGIYPVDQNGIKYDRFGNSIFINYARHLPFDDDTVLFVYTTYVYDRIEVPNAMEDLQSNRFDVILQFKTDDELDSEIMAFLVDYLLQIKAFHSLLRKIILNLSLNDTYLVTDLCVGGDITQRSDTDAGRQQVPPGAIIPHEPDTNDDPCAGLDPQDLGYRPWDLEYRKIVLDNLEAEFEAWKSEQPDCALTPKGQDRVTGEREPMRATSDGESIDEDRPRDTLCELDGRDYCYQGRVSDPLGIKPRITLDDTWRFKPCELGMGYGVYYTFEAPRYIIENRFSRYIGSTEKDGLEFGGYFGKLFGLYGRHEKDSIHYSDSDYLGVGRSPSRYLGVRRPHLDIQKDNLNFPQHRMPSMFALTEDFVHSRYKLRPWDIRPGCHVQLRRVGGGDEAESVPNCGQLAHDNPLHAHLEVDSSGDEMIVFDDAPYAIEGNGLPMDISTLGDHTKSTVIPVQVTHKIYADISPLEETSSDAHNAVVFTNSVPSIGIIPVDEDSDGRSIINFKSATDYNGAVYDFSDGYPAEVGYLDTTVEPWDARFLDGDTGGSEQLREMLDVPGDDVTYPDLFYTLSSQVRIHNDDVHYGTYSPYRIDCGCLRIDKDIDTTDDTSSDITGRLVDCTLKEYLDDFSEYNPDKVEIVQSLPLEEIYNTDSISLNSKRSTLFDVDGSTNGRFPDNGHFIYRDDYGVIYEHRWYTESGFVDYILITRNPVVWGQPKTGRVENGKIFRNGTVTTTRTVYRATSFGYEIINSSFEQSVEEYEDTAFQSKDDVFKILANHPLSADVEVQVLCGPRWVDPDSDSTDDTVEWTPVASEQSQPLMWMEMFTDGDDLISICAGDTADDVDNVGKDPVFIIDCDELHDCYQIKDFHNSMFSFTCDAAVPALEWLPTWDGKFYRSVIDPCLFKRSIANHNYVILKTIQFKFVESGIQSYWEMYLEVWRQSQIGAVPSMSCFSGIQSATYRRFDDSPSGEFILIGDLTSDDFTGPDTIEIEVCEINDIDPTVPIIEDPTSDPTIPDIDPTSGDTDIDDEIPDSPYNPSDPGYTRPVPSADTMFVYVSTSDGDDDNNGLTQLTPVASLGRALEIIRPDDGSRNNKPDWILFKRGDEFGNAFQGINFKFSGRSNSERFVLTGYGSGNRPKFSTDSTGISNYIEHITDEVNNIAIIGLHFCAHKRNPNSAGFEPSHAGMQYNALDFRVRGSNWLIEDCVFDYYNNNIYINIENELYSVGATNVVIRRNIITNAYNGLSNIRSHGIYTAGCNDVDISENFIDNNGWQPNIPIMTLGSIEVGASPEGWDACGVSSFNGSSGIVWRESNSRSLYAWILDEEGGFTTDSIYVDDTEDDNNYAFGAIISLNEALGVIWRDIDTGDNTLWMINNGSVVEIPLQSRPELQWEIIGAGNITGNSYIDIIWRNQDTGAIELWAYDSPPGQDAYEYSAVIELPPMQATWNLGAIVDINNNGNNDLIWHNSVSGEIIIWYMDGASRDSIGRIGSEFTPRWSITGSINYGEGCALVRYAPSMGTVQIESIDRVRSREGSHSIVCESDDTSSDINVIRNIIMRSGHKALKLKTSGTVEQNMLSYNPEIGFVGNDHHCHTAAFRSNAIADVTDANILGQTGGIEFVANKRVDVDNNIFTRSSIQNSDKCAVRFGQGASDSNILTNNIIYNFIGGIRIDGANFWDLEISDNQVQYRGDKTYLEYEAESALISGDMAIEFDTAASNEEYVVPSILDDDQFINDPNGPDDTPQNYIRFDIVVPHDGIYYIIARTISSGGSFWVSIDDGEPFIWNVVDSDVWAWARINDLGIDIAPRLSPGNHSITVMYRTNDVKLDKIIVTNDDQFTPHGLGNIPLTNHYLVRHNIAPGDETKYNNNTFYYGPNLKQWFYISNDRSFNEFIDYIGGNEHDQLIEYNDPNRSLLTYNVSLGGIPTISDFVSRATSRAPGTWDDRYAAPSIVGYIRSGFDVSGI